MNSKGLDAARFFSQFGLALQVLRHKSGLSIDQFGKRAGIGKSQMSKYENGKQLPNLETVARILDALQVEPLWLFYLMHQLSREQPLDSLTVDLLLLRDDVGFTMSRSEREAFLRIFAGVLDLHAIVAAERCR